MADFTRPVLLPGTDLRVGRLGVGPDYRIGADAYEEAFERGLNYFYEGGTPIPTSYAEALGRALRKGRE
ncbi:MAG: hypothetical protein K8I02_08805, partial [Candidatus Methylomirabilis sp.]|nr:hypothetical protein [Deltaproteobacteria bacterium]